MNYNLPVLILKKDIVLPDSEARLDLDYRGQKIIALSENFYNKQFIIVNTLDLLEENINSKDLPSYGVLATLKFKVKMPDNYVRVIIEAIRRVNISDYVRYKDRFEASFKLAPLDKISLKEELAYVKALFTNIERYTEKMPNASNTVISKISGVTNIEELTNVIPLFLPLSLERKRDYLKETSSVKRAEMILKDMSEDLEILKIEKKIDDKVEEAFQMRERDFILHEKIKAIKEELGEVDQESNYYEKKYQIFDAPLKVKEKLRREINRLDLLSKDSPEYGMATSYIDSLLSLPFKKETKDEDDLEKVLNSLNESHANLDLVKKRFIEYLAVKKYNPKSKKSPIICLVGSPGVGKTSFALSVAQSLKRKSVKISLGGVTDEADIVGHRRTYVGAYPGLIMQGISKAGTINPVFVIDEIDKMGKSLKGDPASSLLEVLDSTINDKFYDHFLEIEYDLSKVMFITTANNIEDIPIPLRDRLEIIEISSYTEREKIDIALKHLIPESIKEHGLNREDLIFKEDIILKLIREYTKEAGVRELKRVIDSINRKIVTDKVIHKNKSKVNINADLINYYLGNPKYLDNKIKDLGVGVINGLFYTPYGGDILRIEAVSFDDLEEKLILTGSLGEILKEQAQLALDYIKANSKIFGLNSKTFKDKGIHIHFPSTAIKKEGSSGGISIVTVLLSLFKEQTIKSDIAFTGEVSLRGEILPVGGIKEKVIGALRAGVKTIYLPLTNKNDVLKLDDEIIKKIDFKYVDNYLEIYKKLFK